MYVKVNRFSAHKLPMIRPPSGTYYLTYNVTLRQLDSGCLSTYYYCLTRLDHSTTTSHQSSRMWLPFSLRCKLRILSIIHKSIYSFTPSYISDLIKKRTILSSLRYQNAPLLISQNSSKTSLNSRVFKNSGPTLWNSLLPFVLLDPTKDL